MISVLAYHVGQGAMEVEHPETISEIVGRDGCLVWVDLLDPTDADLKLVEEEFHLHPLAIEDARKHEQRPKLEQYPTHAFVVAYDCRLAEVDLFVGPDWLVSVREENEEGHAWAVDGARARFERTRPEHATVGFLLYVLLDELVDGYFVRADDLEDRLEGLEDRIFADDWDTEVGLQEDMFTIRRDLVEFRRRVVPLREVVNSLLRGELDWLDKAAVVHLQDVYDHVLRSIDVIDSHRELLGNAVEAHLAVVSNNMNLVMKKMTSWGALLLGATLIAGIYGMNFEHMPELGWSMGYPFALGLMAVITVFGYRRFKRRGWL
jgi:magnesium transporter